MKKIIVLLIILTIPAIYQLIRPGFYEPHDLHHLADIYQMYRAFTSGQLPPRLGPDFIWGYGYPLFNFYYLLPFYLGSLWLFLFGSLTASFEFVFIVSAFVSVFGMYLFLKEFFKKSAAVTGSLLFLYTPYRAVQIYVRGAMGEALALSLIPLFAWSLVRLVKAPRSKSNLVLNSLILAFFILSHNYLWAISLPYLFLLFLFLVRKEDVKITLINISFSGLLSLGLTAYWWLPAILEQNLVSSTTPFPLIDHFPFIKQLIFPSWGYGSSVWGPGDEISFQIGVVNLGIFLIFLPILIFKGKNLYHKNSFKIALWSLVGFLISLLMMNIRTLPIWQRIPFHDFIQFPWRLLIFTTFFSSIMAAYLVNLLNLKFQKTAAIVVIGLSMLLTIEYFQPSRIFNKSDDVYLETFFADRTMIGEKESVSAPYLNYSEDYLLLPDWVDEKPNFLPESKIETDEGKVQNVIKLSAIHWTADVVAMNPTAVQFNSLYFPGWTSKIDGKTADIEIGEPYGQIVIKVSEGEHNVEFFWKETMLRKSADLISVLSMLVLIIFTINILKKPKMELNNDT